jgi:hypothetical protein
MKPATEPRRPHRTLERIVELAALALPRGDIRRRYEREFVAELYDLDGWGQARHALGVLLSVRSLHTAVTTDDYTRLEESMGHINLRRPLTCRLNLHHHWRTGQTEDGEQYTYCVRCDKIREGDPRRTVSGLWGMAGG